MGDAVATQSIPYSLSAFGIALQELPKALANAHESTTSTSTTSNNSNKNGSSSSHKPAVLQELQEAAYAAVLRLARDVGNASQLCEAIGATLRSHPNESKTAIALLGCAHHSLGVVPELADNNRRFAGRVFPLPYLTTLTQILATWSADARVHAAAMLAATLPCCGPSLQDDKQAATLLSTAQALACGDKPGLPKDVTVLDAVAISCIGSKRPEALLNGVRLVLDVQQSALRWAAGVEVGVSSISNQWGAALLMLTNALLHCLAESGQCATLQTLQFTVGPAAVGGSITSLTGGLMAAKVSFADSTEAETAAATCLQRAAAQSSETGWSGRVVDAVCSVSACA